MGIPHHKTRNLSQRAHGKSAACLLRIFQLATVIACMHDLLFLGDSVAAQLGAFLKLNSKHEIKKRGKPNRLPEADLTLQRRAEHHAETCHERVRQAHFYLVLSNVLQQDHRSSQLAACDQTCFNTPPKLHLGWGTTAPFRTGVGWIFP